MEKNINLIVGEDENNLRLDVFINKRESLISRTRIKNLILNEKLKLNDEIIKSLSRVSECDFFIGSDSVSIECSEMKPIVVRGVGEVGFLYLMMPMNR